jgi:hypothetical protein
MASKADQVAAQARAALAGATSPASRTVDQAADDARAARGQRRARTDKVRKTVDLAPTRYHDLAALMGEWAVQLGVARVTSQDALDAAVRAILTDVEVERRVRAKLEDILAE